MFVIKNYSKNINFVIQYEAKDGTKLVKRSKLYWLKLGFYNAVHNQRANVLNNWQESKQRTAGSFTKYDKNVLND